MNFKKYSDKILVFFVLVLFLLVFLFKGGFNNYSENILPDGNDKDMNFFYSNENENKNQNTQDKDINIKKSSDEDENEKIIVHVSGEVKNPGIYEFEDGDRVNDAIEKAGGLTENAYKDGINLALKLRDEMKVTIYTLEEYKKLGLDENSSDNFQISGLYDTKDKNGKVSLNRASKEELMTLPGVGPKTADKIIEYREKNKFESIEDIKNINGIGDKTFERLKDLIQI